MNDARRYFLQRVMAAAAGATVVGSDVFALSPKLEQRAQRYLQRMLSGLEMGGMFFNNWSLSQAYPPRAGAVILNIQSPEGSTLRVDVCKRGMKPLAPAVTRDLELFVMDGGGGKSLYSAEKKFALQYLAEVLQENCTHHDLPNQLFTHAERLEMFPNAMSQAACELVPTLVDGDW